MPIDKGAPVQLHYQLTNALRNDIQNGEWNIGDLFPADREIMEHHNVSATTVRRAVRQLVNEGWLERKPGKGTFIVKEPIREDLVQLTGFFEEMYNQGMNPSADILFKGIVKVDSDLIKQHKALSKFNEKELVLLEKLHKVNNQPLFYVQSYWLRELGEKFLSYDLTFRGAYDIAAKDLKILLTKADEVISAGWASKKEAEVLGVKTGFPVLILKRIIFAGDRMVEFSNNVCRADRYQYHIVRMSKNQKE